MTLFGEPLETSIDPHAPLADRMRPRTPAEFVGQEHLLAVGAPLYKQIESDQLTSTILWGPPGSGKTALANVVAHATSNFFAPFSAVTSGIKEIREAVEDARNRRRLEGIGTILFVDEIHRFNRAQQDAFLPHVEDGTIVLLGATTENPSFEVNSPLLSRMAVVILKPLTPDEINTILSRALADTERGLGKEDIELDESARAAIVRLASGDARAALNVLEMAVRFIGKPGEKTRITAQVIGRAANARIGRYDKHHEEHFNLISALHKSLRSSHADAALYWLARMLEAGEDPLYIARRLVRFASEDVGLADPQALQITVAAKEAVHFIGMPEGALALAEAAVYLATAPKSNSINAAYDKAAGDCRDKEQYPVPMHLRNAPTALMKEVGYGKDYRYDHNFEEHFSGQECLPENLKGAVYYTPGSFGFEKEIARRLDYFRKLRTQKETGRDSKDGKQKK